MTKLRTHRLSTFAPARLCIIVLFCVAAAIASLAQSIFFTSLVSFTGTNGTAPLGLVQASDGYFYGTTVVGGGTACNGGYGCGTVFRVSASGTLTTLYSFQGYPYGPDGAFPYAGLVQGPDGNLYGTTYMGGTSNWGTVFKITTGGTLTTLYSFCTQPNCPDGAYPHTPLVHASDGNFYGTNDAGGGGNCYGGCGTVFKITPSGALTTLYSFCPQNGCPDGSSPFTGLVQAADGNFYGANHGGGAYLKGTIFRITPQGTLTTLYTFCAHFGCPDGDEAGGLVQGSDGNFYGATSGGGNSGLPFCPYGCGTVFKITAGGTLTTLYRFRRSDGADPAGVLVQGGDGDFYGGTLGGGSDCFPYGCGTVFKITAGGTLTTLYSFDGTDGFNPNGLVQARDGNFYGTTEQGGDNQCTGWNGCGTVFRLGVANPCATCRP